ncbi:MAG: prepilin peptidase [Chloroflexi bacterium]|nr:prepilin peptidase [Chloroflexota bacterium]
MEIVLLIGLGLLVGAGIHRLADALPTRAPVWRIPNRAPLVILGTAALFAFLWVYYSATVQLALALIYTAVLVLVLVIDYEHRLILNVVILPAIVFALIASPFTKLGWMLSLLGGVVAFAFVFAIYIAAPVFSRWRGHTLAVPFGFGDVKLAAFVGIITGFPMCVYAMVVAILLGGFAAIGVLLYQFARTRRVNTGVPIAYGPYFCIAGWLLMVFRI